MSEKEIEGVPMPEQDGWFCWAGSERGHSPFFSGYEPLAHSERERAFTQTKMRTYGIACRAAGEAAGYAQGLRDAVRDADIEALRLYVRALCKAVDAATDFAGTVAGGASWLDDVWADHAAALDRARERISQAALRGEVKP